MEGRFVHKAAFSIDVRLAACVYIKEILTAFELRLKGNCPPQVFLKFLFSCNFYRIVLSVVLGSVVSRSPVKRVSPEDVNFFNFLAGS